MKLFGKNFATQFSDQFFDALCDDTVTLRELDELALTDKIIHELSSFDEKSIKTWLESEQKTPESLLRERDERGTALRQFAEKLGYPLDDPFVLCQKIAEQPEYTEEMASFLRLFLPSHQFILNPMMSKDESKLEQVTNYALILDEIAEVERILVEIERLRDDWLSLKHKLLCPSQFDLQKTAVTVEDLQKSSFKHLKICDKECIFAYNLENILSELNGNTLLRKIAPLYLFKMLVKHKSRLQKNSDVSVSLASLWKFDSYSIESDNGRNFNTNRSYLALFHDLCTLFQEDSLVDILLNKWGFYQSSNLLEFDRTVTEEFSELSFPLFDQLLEDSLFSCYRCGGYDAVLLKELGIPLEKVLFFQSMPQYAWILAEITEYMCENANTLVEHFLDCSKEEVIPLCTEILQNSLKGKEKSSFMVAQRNLISCAINLALQEYVDSFAKEYLIQWLIRVFRGVSS